MDTALTPKFPFILDRNLAKANCIGNRVCTSCDIVVLSIYIFTYKKFMNVCSLICRHIFFHKPPYTHIIYIRATAKI